jgi:hypothetical protein
MILILIPGLPISSEIPPPTPPYGGLKFGGMGAIITSKIFLYPFFYVALYLNNLVERFVLIATTGKKC